MTEQRSMRAAPAVWLVLLAAGGTFAVTMGARQSMGLFLGNINSATGLGIASISLAFAFGQLWWGLTQPIAGLMADRVGAGRVIVAGVLMVALGTALIPFMQSTAGLILAIGVLAAGGAGLAGVSVLMAATARLIPAEKRGMATGIVNAGGSFGQFLFAPIAGGIAAAAGWVAAVQSLALLSLLALPAAWVLRGSGAAALKAAGATGAAAAPVSSGSALRKALADPSYRLLSAGFFVCGFHVAFIATHLPGVVASCQLPPAVGAWSLAMIGLFNIIGSFAIGWAIGFQGGRWRMKSLLSLIYATRALAVLIFVLAPKTEITMLVFAAVIGLTYLSTVPPTAGLVAKFHGTANMGLLFGVVMLAHQIGGFLGAYLGGKSFELTGSYDWMWYADILLAVAAALLHLPIREARKLAVVKPAAA
ncbi:MFS transporter [Rivibacter subsaxonicus]|uniref:Putative MFS family arabinose efflux permease n=1 Tax=Rivibacter subsaxonicus TaxID=457575 RepID=A0A4Q7W151_9BURK|nr:MFS transporter [Rivibacter subsaxonicus]RZU02565.1 putative MFS family arabinose efflux permease [Rivibacter subsaxonicus]